MSDLSNRSLDELLEIARRVHALDDWQESDEVIVFQLATMSIAIRKSSAKSFVRGLLRGFQRAETVGRGDRAG